MSSFQTSVFENGAWVTRSVQMNEALRSEANATASRPVMRTTPKPVDCGILTRTLVESPAVNYILPVRLRGNQYNDVAFIGDHYVQICELLPPHDESLRNVVRKTDFGSRIRNAKVLGPLPDIDQDSAMGGTQDVEHSAELPVLPPQMLILVLENGDVVFLFVEGTKQGTFEFQCIRQESVNRTDVGFPGFLMAIDPESRYLSLACSEGLVVVHQLESMERLREEHQHGRALRPVVKTYKKIFILDVLQKMEFLYPQHNHPYDNLHTILIFVTVEREQAKMITYDWDLGDDLDRILDDRSRKPHKLPAEHQTPIMLVPLTVLSSFLLISDGAVAACRGVLTGSHDFDSVTVEYSDQTDMHHGLDPPLWTAWTRPYRLHSYSETKDNIYLGREDGVVALLEIDNFSILSSSVTVGKFDCNIATAFCSVRGRFCDLLIIGGESGPGKIIKLPARKPVTEVGIIPNWAPSVDLAIVADSSTVRTDNSLSTRHFIKPDRIFATTGKGVHGAITEYRHGIEARIGLEMEHHLSSRAWLLRAFDTTGNIAQYHILLSVANTSEVLGLSPTCDSVSALSAEEIPYDLSSPTVDCLQTGDGLIIQVTEDSISLVTPSQHARHPYPDLLQSGIYSTVCTTIEPTALVLATHSQSKYQFHVLSITDLALNLVKTIHVDGAITAMATGTIRDRKFILVALWRNALPALALYSVTEDLSEVSDTPIEMTLATASMSHEPPQEVLDPASTAPNSPIEPVTTVLVTGTDDGSEVVVIGTRSGDILTIYDTGRDDSNIYAERIGVAASHVYRCGMVGGFSATLVCTGDKLFLLSQFSRKTGRFSQKNQVFAVNLNNQSLPTIPITSVTALDFNVAAAPGDGLELLMLGETSEGTKILLTQLMPQVRPLPRNIPLNGTATVVKYSKGLGCLVAGVERGGASSLVFADPDTGDDLSRPTDKDGISQPSISGLGKPDDKIFCLHEWLYRNNGRTWRFFVAGTRQGRIVIVSAEVEEQPGGANDVPCRRIRYWTRYKTRVPGPVFSIVGGNEGLFFCAAKILYWQRLDLDQKRLVEVLQYDLNSPATTLRLHGNYIFSLCARHSVEILETHRNGDSGSIELAHCDPITREASHVLYVGEGEGKRDGDTDDQFSNLLIVSDRQGGITGVTIPWFKLNAELKVVFDGELPSSIRRLRTGFVRPYYQQLDRKVQYGALRSTPEGGDILGLCIDGSLIHLTLIDIHTTRLLRLIQALAEESELICPFNLHENDDVQDEEPSGPTYKKHIDGDILQRCLDKRVLEELVKDAGQRGILKYQELLGKIEGGKWTQDFKPEDLDRWFELGYDLVEYFLEPVL